MATQADSPPPAAAAAGGNTYANASGSIHHLGKKVLASKRAGGSGGSGSITDADTRLAVYRPFELLSNEVVLHVLSFLDPRSLLRSARLCKRFKRLALDNNVWYLLCCRRRRNLTRFTRYNLKVNYHPLYRDDYLFGKTLAAPERITAEGIDMPVGDNESIEWIERFPNLDDALIAFSCIIKREEPDSEVADPVYFYRLVVSDLQGASEHAGSIDFDPIEMDVPMQMSCYQSVLSVCKQMNIIALGVWKYGCTDVASCRVELRRLGGKFELLRAVEVPGYVEQLELYFRSQMPNLFSELEVTAEDDYVMWYFRKDNPDDGVIEQLYTYSPTAGHVKWCNFSGEFEHVRDVYYNPHHFKKTMISVHVPDNDQEACVCNDLSSIMRLYARPRRQPIHVKVWSFFQGSLTHSFPITQCPHPLDESAHLLTHEELGIWILYGRVPLQLAFPDITPPQSHIPFQPSSLLFHYFDPSLPVKGDGMRYMAQVGLQGIISCCTHEGYLITLEDTRSVAAYDLEDVMACRTTGLSHLRHFLAHMRGDNPVRAAWRQPLAFDLGDVVIGENVVLCFRACDGNVWILAVVRKKVWKIKFDLPYKVQRKPHDEMGRGVKESRTSPSASAAGSSSSSSTLST
ncbi:hypothetical protein RI367_006379 [Sorochytrium milnesiophthora]